MGIYEGGLICWTLAEVSCKLNLIFCVLFLFFLFSLHLQHLILDYQISLKSTDSLIFVHLQTDLCNICVKCKWQTPELLFVQSCIQIIFLNRIETNFIDNFFRNVFLPDFVFS